MRFEDAYEELRDSINSTKWGARIPGMDADDVGSEMLVCLWKACETYDDGSETSFPAYWWSVWLNHRKNLLRSIFAKKRGPLPVLVDEFHEHVTPAVVDSHDLLHMPSIEFETVGEAFIWSLLAHGHSPTEVIETLGISRRQFYAQIKQWKTDRADEVRKALYRM